MNKGQSTWRAAFDVIIREYRQMNLLANAAKSRGDREAFIDFCMILSSLSRVCNEMVEQAPILKPVWDEVRRVIQHDVPYDRIAAGEMGMIIGKEQGMLTDET